MSFQGVTEQPEEISWDDWRWHDAALGHGFPTSAPVLIWFYTRGLIFQSSRKRKSSATPASQISSPGGSEAPSVTEKKAQEHRAEGERE